MNTTTTICLLLVCFNTMASQVIEGDFPLITIGTNTFTNAHLRAYSATEGSLRHAGGSSKINLCELPEPARAQFYDPQKAAAAAAAKEEASAAKRARADAANEASLEAYKATYYRIVGGKFSNLNTDKRWETIDGQVAHVLPNGVLFRVYEQKPQVHVTRSDSLVSHGNFLGSGSGSSSYTTYHRQPTAVMVFIACDPQADGLYGGQDKELQVIKTGPMKVNGATHPGYDAGLPYRPASR